MWGESTNSKIVNTHQNPSAFKTTPNNSGHITQYFFYVATQFHIKQNKNCPVQSKQKTWTTKENRADVSEAHVTSEQEQTINKSFSWLHNTYAANLDVITLHKLTSGLFRLLNIKWSPQEERKPAVKVKSSEQKVKNKDLTPVRFRLLNTQRLSSQEMTKLAIQTNRYSKKVNNNKGC